MLMAATRALLEMQLDGRIWNQRKLTFVFVDDSELWSTVKAQSLRRIIVNLSEFNNEFAIIETETEKIEATKRQSGCVRPLFAMASWADATFFSFKSIRENWWQGVLLSFFASYYSRHVGALFQPLESISWKLIRHRYWTFLLRFLKFLFSLFFTNYKNSNHESTKDTRINK